jgi:membrane glycosyltransferase
MLKATPPIRRTSMVPEAWRTNILVRASGDSLLTHAQQPSRLQRERSAAQNRWRVVGSMRRYMLLVLMLVQTIVATWYMKGDSCRIRAGR